MSDERYIEGVKWGGLWLILLLGVCAMVLVSFHDYDWTRGLIERDVEIFSDWMDDSIFEGENLGGGDFSVFLMIAAGLVYAFGLVGALYYSGKLSKPLSIKSFVEKKRRLFKVLGKWYPQSAFVLVAGLCSSVYLVQALKWATGRARPKMVLERGLEFSAWYEYGPYFIGRGSFRGSFPSGHAAAACVLMTLGYVLMLGGKGIWTRVAGWVLFGVCCVFSFAMLTARGMNSAHWISDSMFSIFASLLIIHVTYFWGLNIPWQAEHYREHGEYPAVLEFFELRFALVTLAMFAGIFLTGVGVRGIMLGFWLYSTVAPVGLALFVFSFLWLKKMSRRRKNVPGTVA